MSAEQKDIPSLDEMVFFEEEEHGKNLSFASEEDTDDNQEDLNEDNEEEDVVDNVESTIDNTIEEGEEASESVYTNQYNYLKDLGLLSVEEGYEFDGSPEALEEIVEKTKQDFEIAGATSIWNKLPDDFKIVLEYALAGGTDINKVQSLLVKEVDLSKVDIEDEDDQERVTRQLLRKTTKFDDKKIDNYIKKLKLSGSLEEEAEGALEELKKLDVTEKQELLKQTQLEQAQRQELMVNSYKKFNDVVTKLEGVDKKRQQQIVSSIWTVGQYGDYDGISYFNYVDHLAKSNPEHLAQLAQLYLSYDAEKGFVNNDLKKKAVSEATNKLRDTFDKFDSNSGKAKVKENTNKQKRGQSTETDKLQAWLQQTRM